MDPVLLVRLHAPAVFALCRAMVRDRQLAEDLAQDTFARAIAALDSYRGDASPRTWLLKIARNRCLDHLDHVRRAPWGLDPDPDPDAHPIDVPAPIELLANRDDAERAISVLGESERALVVLHFGHGVGYPELAASFGIAQGTVRMRVSRALAKMRDALQTQDDALSYDERAFALDEAEAEPDESTAAAPALREDFDDFEVERATAPATFDALYTAPSPQLWARLDALVSSTRHR